MSSNNHSIYLINPQLPDSHNGFRGMEKMARKKWVYSPLSIATISALTPPGFDVTCCDENIEPVNYDHKCDIVGISSIYVQAKRTFQIADEFRKRGKLVVLGGPLPSSSTEISRRHADVVFVGEAESTWPQFLSDFLEGRQRTVYSEEGLVDMLKSPVPHFEKLKLDQYLVHCIQTTRGCPFSCEFCDVPAMHGRSSRYKTPEQVVAEVNVLVNAGSRYIWICDDNFIGNKQHAKNILTALIEYKKNKKANVAFSAESSINVAAEDEILELLRAINCRNIFIGIESPRTKCLKETHKYHNTIRPLIEDIRKIQSHGITVVSGMIVGFDNDDKEIFEDQFNFLMEAGIPMVTISILRALPGTALYNRMIEENRLLPADDPQEFNWTKAGCANFALRHLTAKQLSTGYQWLWRMLFQYQAFAKRVIGNYRHQSTASHGGPFSIRDYLETIVLLVVGVKKFLFTRDCKKRKFFINVLGNALKLHFSCFRLKDALLVVWSHQYMREVIIKVYGYGDPEECPANPWI